MSTPPTRFWGLYWEKMAPFAPKTTTFCFVLLQKCSLEYKLSLKYLESNELNELRKKPYFPWAVLHPNCTAAKKLIVTDLECSSWVNTTSNWILSFLYWIYYTKIWSSSKSHSIAMGLHLSLQHRFSLYIHVYTCLLYTSDAADE